MDPLDAGEGDVFQALQKKVEKANYEGCSGYRKEDVEHLGELVGGTSTTMSRSITYPNTRDIRIPFELPVLQPSNDEMARVVSGSNDAIELDVPV
jgi:hypothetical protein